MLQCTVNTISEDNPSLEYIQKLGSWGFKGGDVSHQSDI